MSYYFRWFRGIEFWIVGVDAPEWLFRAGIMKSEIVGTRKLLK